MMAVIQNLCNEIFAIARTGDLQGIHEFYADHPEIDINICNELGESLLIYCAKRVTKEWKLPFGGEFLKICEELISRDIDVNIRDATERSAVYYAVALDAYDLTMLLIRHNALLDMHDMDNNTTLDLIAQKGEVDWVRRICKKEGKNNMSSQQSLRSALFHSLLSTNHMPCIKWMCEHYPGVVNDPNEDGLTSLHVAVIKHNVELCSLLLNYEVNIEAVDRHGHTSLHYAAVHGHADCIALLLSSGAEVNYQDNDGASALHYAVTLNLTGITGTSRVQQSRNNTEVEYLIKYGASVILMDHQGRVPLHWATNADNASACKMLVAKGCPVNLATSDGLTALHIAASKGYTECVRVLIVNCKADVNVTDKAGNTPLLYALSKRHLDCAELLLCDGASSNKLNNQGLTIAHYIASEGLTNSLEIIHKYEGSLNLPDIYGNRPLHHAVLRKNLGAVDYMLRCKCDADSRNKNGYTPLYLAASLGSVAVCRCLISAGASVNGVVRNSKKEYVTALDAAFQGKHTECWKFLKNNGALSGKKITNEAAKKIQSCWRRCHKTVSVDHI